MWPSLQLLSCANIILVYLSLKLCWRDLNKEFEEKLVAFRTHVKRVEKEAGLSSMIEAHGGWAVAEYERKGELHSLLLSRLHC